jgi:hypothetical protein
MPFKPTSQQAGPTAIARTGKPGSGRQLALAAAAVFVVSSLFPVVAGFVKDNEAWPKWWGVLDVGIAFILAMLAFAVMALGKVNQHAQEATYRAYRVLIHGVFSVLVAFFILGDRIVWGNCLTGFAWRFWLLLYSLPSWFALVGTAKSD